MEKVFMEVQKLTMLREVSEHYNWLGTVVDFSQCINGHINDTYRVKVENKNGNCEEYIFQRINEVKSKLVCKLPRHFKCSNQPMVASVYAAKAVDNELHGMLG
jgi:hypothetical protein